MEPRYYWLEFYERIKEPDWPPCHNEHEFQDLPSDIQQKIIDQHQGSRYLRIRPSQVRVHALDYDFKEYLDPPSQDDDYDGDVILDREFVISRDFRVLYNDSIDGHGSQPPHQHFSKMLRCLYPGRRFDRALEWCSGPAFIGFRLVSDGLVRDISLLDRHRPALTACQRTWAQRPSRLETNVMTLYHSPTVGVLGDAQFDLVVSNPPNWDFYNYPQHRSRWRITQDPGWRAHNDFFANIRRNLCPGGVILMVKNIMGGQPREYVRSIEDGGLRINRVMTLPGIHDQHYWLEITAA